MTFFSFIAYTRDAIFRDSPEATPRFTLVHSTPSPLDPLLAPDINLDKLILRSERLIGSSMVLVWLVPLSWSQQRCG
jgi:hypothetical protein